MGKGGGRNSKVARRGAFRVQLPMPTSFVLVLFEYTLEPDGHQILIKAATKRNPSVQDVVSHAVRRQLYGLIGAGRPANSSQTDSSADERSSVGAVELPSNDGYSWMAWGAFARVLPMFPVHDFC